MPSRLNHSEVEIPIYTSLREREDNVADCKCGRGPSKFRYQDSLTTETSFFQSTLYDLFYRLIDGTEIGSSNIVEVQTILRETFNCLDEARK